MSVFRLEMQSVDSPSLVFEYFFESMSEAESWRDSQIAKLEKNPESNNFNFTITDVTSDMNQKASVEAKRLIGRVLRELSQSVLDIMTGHLSTENLTEQEIIDLKASFAPVYNALSQNMPLIAKSYIDQISPDGNLVTQEMIDDVNYEYATFKENYPTIINI